MRALLVGLLLTNIILTTLSWSKLRLLWVAEAQITMTEPPAWMLTPSLHSPCRKIQAKPWHIMGLVGKPAYDCVPESWYEESQYNMQLVVEDAEGAEGASFFGLGHSPQKWQAHLLVRAKNPYDLLRIPFNYGEYLVQDEATCVLPRPRRADPHGLRRYLNTLPHPPPWWDYALRKQLIGKDWTAVLIVFGSSPRSLIGNGDDSSNSFDVSKLGNALSLVAWNDHGFPIYYASNDDLRNEFAVMREYTRQQIGGKIRGRGYWI